MAHVLTGSHNLLLLFLVPKNLFLALIGGQWSMHDGARLTAN
jgi:hypothetical protein